ncbi:MAG: hypothetical protein KDC44_05235 [Phaeodactylibacter sp.]|nr:hypothetical protein [Phaeodactylibacter sp.]
MRTIQYGLLTFAFSVLWAISVDAHINPFLEDNKPAPNNNTAVSFREDCSTPKAEIDQGRNRLTGEKVNNVRARLTTGGDNWWDRADGKYVVPFVDEGQDEVSSIFAGGVWLGGFDPGNNLKVACQTYGNPQGNTDFFTGPLDPVEGITDAEICEKWDRFFEVYGTEIDEHLAMYEESIRTGIPYTEDMIPKGVKAWPARGNEFFFEINEFDLPTTNQGLAGFYDRNGDTFYDPLDGDYPIIEIRGCEEPQYPDQMIFWIYNDAGGIHGETNGQQIQMEVQVQAFSYGTNDQINDMTFQRYKLINRAIEDIDSTYFAMWVDADLGCYTDDYIGCDVDRALAYTYNADAIDGDTGPECFGVATYGSTVPIIGIDYFRGPLKPYFNSQTGELDSLIELGMSSFTYFNNGSVNNPPAGTTDPNLDSEYYNYLSGTWRDGTPFTFGGSAYGGTELIDYAFVDPPNQTGGWSMCEEDLPEYDRRTVQASGPFLLKPGAINELIIGAVWVPDLDYPCPSINRLFAADDLAQNLFNVCFEITDGPDAPDIDLIELDRKLVLVLTNDTLTSNNAYEQYEELDLLAPNLPDIDSTYNFEGYIIYQLSNPTVSTQDYSDPDQAREVAKVDVKNGILELYNWTSVPNPNSGPDEPDAIWYPEIQVESLDEGIRHTFEVTTDQFASGDSRLVNHRKYYFSSIAYGYNNWEDYDSEIDYGQKRQYLEGRRNIKTYTAIPRPITDVALNADYGDGPVITRLDGVGVGGNFVDMTAETREAILKGDFDGSITYVGGRGPVDVNVYNPLEVVDGEYLLTFVDENMGDSDLNDEVYWELRNLTDPTQPVIRAERTIDALNEQVIAEYGFTVTIGQTDDVGEDPELNPTNGAIGYEEEYADPNAPQWFSGVPDDFQSEPRLNYVVTASGELDNSFDPNRALSNIGPGYFVPFQLCNYRNVSEGNEYVTPGWNSQTGGFVRNIDLLKNVNNVDIVFTSDRTQWSRCVIVETGSRFYTNQGFTTEGGALQFDLRKAPSVANTGDLVPDPANDGTMGMGYFPGYAIDVETGKRLNIFFGENSIYSNAFSQFYDNGATSTRDMMFNPTSQLEFITGDFSNVFDFYGGGQHFIYVTSSEYDGGANAFSVLSNSNQTLRVPFMQSITWAGWPLMEQGTRMNSYGEGLIPNDLVVKLRVDNPYDVVVGTNQFNGYPSYRLDFTGLEARALDAAGIENQLDMINVVPNPYYAYSQYEGSPFDNIVKITNLPAKCVVSIYTLDGKFIRRYDRDETPVEPSGANRGVRSAQILPDIEWDIKNSKGIPVAAGVYLIHVDAGELGERVIKWFGTNRQFDPSGL